MTILTVAKLLKAIEGLDPDAQVIVGIINGPIFNAAYADNPWCGKAVQLDAERFELRGEAMALNICCYEQARPWEGPMPTINDDGTATLKYDPDKDDPEQGGPPVKGGRS